MTALVSVLLGVVIGLTLYEKKIQEKKGDSD